MTIKQIMDYVMHTPHNTNRAVLAPMLKELAGSGGSGDEPITVAAGLYEAGSNYTVLLKPWDELVAEGTVCVENGAVYAPFDRDNFVSLVSHLLVGDLALPNDGTITRIGNFSKEQEREAGVGNFGFPGCANLTGIKIPNSVVVIGINAFSDCSKLKVVEIPESVAAIKDYAFAGCVELESVRIPDFVIELGVSAFQGCQNLTNIKLSSNIDSIKDYTFSECTSIISIEIPNSVSYLGVRAFGNCENLKTVYIGSGIKYHQYATNYPFEHCPALEKVIIADGATEIPRELFYGCTGLKSVGPTDSGASVEIPDSVKFFGETAFGGCTGLITVEIPNGLTTTYSGTFTNCTNLQSVKIGSGAASFWGDFEGCTNLTSITYVGTVEQWNAIEFGGNMWGNVPATEVVCSDGTVTL